MPKDFTGQLIDGKYRVLRTIGSGTWGVVLQCEHEELSRTVAVKVLHAQHITDPDSRQRFLREAMSLSRLKHKNICQFYSFGVWDGQLYFAMEYIEGRSLMSVLERDGQLSAGRTIDIAGQVCEALECAHKQGVVHRDITPVNILLAEDGTVKLLDFGLAKLLRSDEWKIYTLTQEGLTVGSVLYMSPEQCQGQPVDGRVDIYALGLIIYQCLAGAPAFDAETAVECMYKQINAPLKKVKFQKHSGERVNAILQKATAKQADDRHKDAAELAADLNELKSDEELCKLKALLQSGVAMDSIASTRAINKKSIRLAIVAAMALCAVALTAYLFSRPSLDWDPTPIAMRQKLKRDMEQMVPFSQILADFNSLDHWMVTHHQTESIYYRQLFDYAVQRYGDISPEAASALILSAHDQSGSRAKHADDLLRLADRHLACGDNEQAQELAEVAYDIMGSSSTSWGDQTMQSVRIQMWANFYRARLGAAADLARQLEKHVSVRGVVVNNTKNQWMFAVEALTLLADIARREKNFEDMKAYRTAVLQICRERLGFPFESAYQIDVARDLIAEGKSADAKKVLESVMNGRDWNNMVNGLPDGRLPAARILICYGDLLRLEDNNKAAEDRYVQAETLLMSCYNTAAADSELEKTGQHQPYAGFSFLVPAALHQIAERFQSMQRHDLAARAAGEALQLHRLVAPKDSKLVRSDYMVIHKGKN